MTCCSKRQPSRSKWLSAVHLLCKRMQSTKQCQCQTPDTRAVPRNEASTSRGRARGVGGVSVPSLNIMIDRLDDRDVVDAEHDRSYVPSCLTCSRSDLTAWCCRYAAECASQPDACSERSERSQRRSSEPKLNPCPIFTRGRRLASLRCFLGSGIVPKLIPSYVCAEDGRGVHRCVSVHGTWDMSGRKP